MTDIKKFEEYFDLVEKENKETPYFRTICKDEALKELENIENPIPLVVSDNISTKGIRTTCNSEALRDYIPPFDATVIERFKENGGVILGKTISDEFGVGKTETSFGTNIAVSKGEGIIGLTTAAKGYFHLGANEYNLYSYSPTYGLASRYGVFLQAGSIEKIAVISKEYDDLKKAASIIIGKDKRDGNTFDLDIDFSEYENINLEDITLAELDITGDFKDESAALKNTSLNIKSEVMENIKYALPTFEILSAGEFATNMEKIDGIGLGHRSENYSNFDELYKNSRSEGMGIDVQEKIMFGNFVLSGENFQNYYVQAMKARTMIKENFDKIFEKYEFLVAPISLHYTTAVKLAGLPSLSIPFNDDGILLITKEFNDKRLLSLGKEIIKNIKEA